MKKLLVAILTMSFLMTMLCGCSDEAEETSKTPISETDTKDEEQSDAEDASPSIEDYIDPITVSFEPIVVNPGETFSGLDGMEPVEYTVNDPNNTRGLSTERVPFSFGVAKDETPHAVTVDNQSTFDGWELNALAWDNKTEEKVLYLTFDCGYKYENLTERILDTLKEKDVKAAFFCTLDYLEEDPATVVRMIDEGHIVGNHSTTHPDCTTISREEFAKELLGVDNYMRVNFGCKTKFFRFPTGAFSQNAIDLADGLGYCSVFWSIAHADWDPENQPGVENSFQTVTSRLHPGAVILLHSTSPDNADILGRMIDYARNNGYEFRSLDEYEFWN